MHRASEIEDLEYWKNGTLSLDRSPLKKVIRKAWKRKFGDICQICSCRMHFEVKFRSHPRYATIDHILARGLGGSNSLENVQVVCFTCNNGKSVDEYCKISD